MVWVMQGQNMFTSFSCFLLKCSANKQDALSWVLFWKPVEKLEHNLNLNTLETDQYVSPTCTAFSLEVLQWNGLFVFRLLVFLFVLLPPALLSPWLWRRRVCVVMLRGNIFITFCCNTYYTFSAKKKKKTSEYRRLFYINLQIYRVLHKHWSTGCSIFSFAANFPVSVFCLLTQEHGTNM